MQGQKDIGLNDIGRAQATENGRKLGQILGDGAGDFDFVSSPCWGAPATRWKARVAMGLSADGYRMDERLKELSFGDWEGSTLPSSRSSLPSGRLSGAAEVELHPARRRCRKLRDPVLADRCLAHFGGAPTVCVSHGGVIRSCFRLWEMSAKTRPAR